MSVSGSGISFSGLFSNIDTDAMIEKLISLERAPINLLEKKQSKLTYQKENIQAVNTSLLAIRSAIEALTSSGTAFNNSLTSSDESVLTGSAFSSAAVGTYDVEVLNLAREQIVTSGTKLSTWNYNYLPSVFTISSQNDAGPDFDININTNDTLSTIAATINSSVGGGGEDFSDYGQAQVITDPVSGKQTLVIKANETGVANKFVYKSNSGTNSLFYLGIISYTPGVTLNEPQSALDSKIKIDGITVQSSTNVYENAIPGVTLDLHAANAGSTVEVNVGLGEEEIITNISGFINQFNASTDLMAGFMKESPVASPKNSDEARLGALKGDSDLSSMKAAIRMKTTGFKSSVTSTYTILSQIGINSLSSSGSYVSDNIEFDEDKFKTALASDKDEVVALLNDWADQMDSYLEQQTKVSVIESEAGNFYRRVLSIDSRIDDIGDDIESWEERIVSMEDRMRTQFAMMEDALQKMQSQSSYLSTQLSNLSKASSK